MLITKVSEKKRDVSIPGNRPKGIQEKSEEYVKFDHNAAEHMPYLKGRFPYELEKYYRDRYGPYLPKE